MKKIFVIFFFNEVIEMFIFIKIFGGEKIELKNIIFKIVFCE